MIRLDLEVRGIAGIQCDDGFARGRLFEGLELAAQEGSGHVLVTPRAHPAGDQVHRTLQVDEADVGPRGEDPVAVGALQRRAGHQA